MASLLKKTLTLLVGDTADVSFKVPKKFSFKKRTERELIQLESEIGGTLFGAVPQGSHRQFFNLDAKTWIWYEERQDADGVRHSVTTRYEVQDKGVLKAQDGAQYSYLEGEELRHFGTAVQMYYEQVMCGVYHRDPRTGQKITQNT